jgi:hypothetical protein
MATVYLIHFDRPFKHAKHYVGFCKGSSGQGLACRLAKHRAGTGAKLLRAVNAAGIGWQCVRVWPGWTRSQERKLKTWGGAARICPVCTARPIGGPVRRPKCQPITSAQLAPSHGADQTLRPAGLETAR